MNPFLETVLSNVVFAAALAVVVAVVTTFWRNRHAAHILWVLVLVKLVTPPVWNVPLAMGDAFEPSTSDEVEVERPAPQSTDAAIERIQMNSTLPRIDASSIVIEPIAPPGTAQQITGEEASKTADIAPVPLRTVTTAATSEQPVDWTSLLLQGWGVTSALWLLVAVVRILRFHRLVRQSPGADAALMSQVDSLSRRLGLRTRPQVRVLAGNVSPMVWPLTWKRSLLLPRKLLDELTPSQLDTVIAHELAHLVRRDDWIRFLEAAVTCLFWWNPVVWWARRELHQAEEDCCDALVVCALPESRRQYGEALLRAAEIVAFGRSLPALASAFAQKHFLKRRIEMILMHEFRRGLSWPFKVLLLALAAIVLPLAATAVSQDDPTTTSQQVDPDATSAQNELPVSSQPNIDPSAPQSSGEAANQSAPAPSVSAGDPRSIVALPGMGGFSWQDPHTTTVGVGAERQWTFVDLDTGTSEQLSPYEIREPSVEAQGYDIRLRSWADDIEGRTEFVAVLLDIAYQEWRNGLEGLGSMHLTSIAEAATRSDAIHPGVGIFRTSEGNLGVLEFTTEDGMGLLKYQLIARAGDPMQATDAASTDATTPGGTMPLVAFAWREPTTITVATDQPEEWTFVDLDMGSRAPDNIAWARSPEKEATGYDIRLGHRWDAIDGRMMTVAVLKNLAYRELSDGLEGLSITEILQTSSAPLAEGSIGSGMVIFRTEDGNMGVLELTSGDGSSVLKFELFATIQVPEANHQGSPGGRAIFSNDVPGEPSTTIVADEPASSLIQTVDEVPTNTTQSNDPAATVTWPAPHPNPNAANVAAQSISTDPEVQQLELELLVLDEEAARIQLEAEKRKLEYLMRLVQEGNVGAGSVDEQQLAVDLLEIEVARAHIRRQLYETQISRQQGAGTDGNTVPQQNTPANEGNGRIGHPQRHGRNTVPQQNTPANVPAEPEASTAGDLFDSGFLPGTEPSPSQETSGDPIQDPANPPGVTLEERQRMLDALRQLNQNSANTLEDPQLQTRIQQYEEAFRLQSAVSVTEPRFPRPVRPEGEMAIVRGVVVEQGKPIANQVIWIIGVEDGETVLYQDGPSGDDGTFEFTDVPVGRPWRVFIPYENGPWGFDSGEMITLDDTSDAAIEIIVAGDTVTANLVEVAPSSEGNR